MRLKKVWCGLLLSTGVGLLGSATCAATMLPDRLSEEALVGVFIQNARTGEVLYEKNPHHYFRPASTFKLATGIAALKRLGADARFKTELRYHAQEYILSIKFSGDPTFTTADLSNILQHFIKEHPKVALQHIILDDTAFSGPTFVEGSCIEYHDYYFGAPIQAAMVNKNTASLQLKGTQLNGPVTATWIDEHPASSLKLTNKILLKNEDVCTDEGGLIVQGPNTENSWTLSGCVWPELLSTPLRLALRTPRTYITDVIKNTLTTEKQAI
ncbi:MAG: D-alanyl-D-alanine carboxypeptidase, partial [Pseudomonadota bacterium]